MPWYLCSRLSGWSWHFEGSQRGCLLRLAPVTLMPKRHTQHWVAEALLL